MPSICTPKCGDSILISFECDDGNLEPNDGCSSSCEKEEGWKCNGAPSVCVPICGDGLIIDSIEQCDDNNNVPEDGCSDTC